MNQPIDLSLVPGPQLMQEIERRIMSRTDRAFIYALAGPSEDLIGKTDTRLFYSGHPLFCRGLLIQLQQYLEGEIQRQTNPPPPKQGGW